MCTRLTSKRNTLTPLQEKFINASLDGFTDRETLELLLSVYLTRRESRQLAKKCLAVFRNLGEFLSASPQELESIGVSHNLIFYIKLLRELPLKMLKNKIVSQSFYKSSKEVFDYLYYSLRDLEKEVFKVIYLDNRSQIIDTVDLFEGTLDSIPVSPRQIVESALTHKSAGIIFVHNHPSGDPAPSKSDKQFTRDLVFVGNIIQTHILDHIIIGDDKYFSFADEGLIKKYELDFLNLKIKGVSETKRSIYRVRLAPELPWRP